ncbi:MAG: hypothetical protein ACTTHG_07495 [Treponemataceae bacterium]
MNAVNYINITNLSFNSQQTLHEGKIVNVKIISQDPNTGKYIASFAGNRFEVKSDIPLQIGSRFFAQINFKGNKILLTTQINQNSALISINSENSIKKLNSKNIENSANNTSLKNYFAKLGLELDTTNLKLLQFLTQNNLKINPELIKRANNKGKKFSKIQTETQSEQQDLQEDAGETCIVLLKKNIWDENSCIQDILEANYGYEHEKTVKNSKKDDNNDEKKQNTENMEETKEPKSFSKLFDDGNSIFEKKFGTLTAFNMLKNSETNFHTIMIPFEFKEDSGVIKLVLDNAKKTLNQIRISYRKSKKNTDSAYESWHFKINIKTKKIQVFSEKFYENDLNFNLKNIIKILEEIFSDFQIEFNENAIPYGMFTEDENINFLEAKQE